MRISTVKFPSLHRISSGRVRLHCCHPLVNEVETVATIMVQNIGTVKIMKFTGVLFMISCFVLNARTVQSNACQSTLSSFSISTQRNNTGHWSSEVTMNIGSGDTIDKDKKQNGPWNHNVSFSIKRCEGKESFQIVADITVPPQKPGTGYEFFTGVGYYKLHTTDAIWNDAREICATEGGHLVILNSNAEANIVKQLLSRLPELRSYAHVGFYDKSGKGQSATIFGKPLGTAGYETWNKSEPNNTGVENCGSVYKDGTLNDISCTKKVPFICEY